MQMAHGGWSVLACVLIGIGWGAASAQTRWVDGILSDEAGVPLFVSDSEPPGQSQCYAACLNIWVPYTASADAKASGDHSLIKRTDGTAQWAYKGKALYRWWNAKQPMDGQGMRGGNWHVVKQ